MSLNQTYREPGKTILPPPKPPWNERFIVTIRIVKLICFLPMWIGLPISALMWPGWCALQYVKFGFVGNAGPIDWWMNFTENYWDWLEPKIQTKE